MSAEVLVAVIGGVVALIGPPLTYFITTAHQNRALARIGSDRREVLTGRWIGTAVQDLGPDSQHGIGRMLFEITASAKTITGFADFFVESSGYKLRLRLSGGILWDRFVRLNYENCDKEGAQFGCFIGELSVDGRKLDGRYVGLGGKANALVGGNFMLTKERL